MKKFFMSLAIMLATSTSFALETMNSLQELVDRAMGETKLTAVVYTVSSDERSKGMLDLIKEYEKTNSDVVFLLAPMENPEIAMGAMALGIQQIPTTLFSRKGLVIGGTVGLPTSKEDIAKALEEVKKLEKQLEEQSKEQSQEIKGTLKKGTTQKIKFFSI